MVQTPFKPSAIAADSLQIHAQRTWVQFKAIQQGLGDAAGVRLFFFERTVEVLMPGRYHELFKKIIASLLEAFLLDHDIAATPTGSMDYEAAGIAAAQPDESYEIGDCKLAIEVIVTSGTIAKLDLYSALGLDEVWFWQDGVLQVYHWVDGQYQAVTQSQIPALAALDLAVLAKCILIGETDWNSAVKALRSAHPPADTARP